MELPLSLSDKGKGVSEGAVGMRWGVLWEGPLCSCETLSGHCWWLLRKKNGAGVEGWGGSSVDRGAGLEQERKQASGI